MTRVRTPQALRTYLESAASPPKDSGASHVNTLNHSLGVPPSSPVPIPKAIVVPNTVPSKAPSRASFESQMTLALAMLVIAVLFAAVSIAFDIVSKDQQHGPVTPPVQGMILTSVPRIGSTAWLVGTIVFLSGLGVLTMAARRTRRASARPKEMSTGLRDEDKRCAMGPVMQDVERPDSRDTLSDADGPTLKDKKGSPALKRTTGVAAATVVGPVREDNQDRARAAFLHGFELLVIADGMGGLPRGGEAADIAVRLAFAHVSKHLRDIAPLGVDAVRALLLEAIWGVARSLAMAAKAMPGPLDQLRTTLVLVVGLPDAFVCAWIGDGGVWVAREQGSTIHLLEPHKDMTNPCVLHASLGPFTMGRPSWAAVGRVAGDLLIAGTDGVMDVVDEDFPAFIRERIQKMGLSRDVLLATLEELARYTHDDGEFAFSDNLTLGVMTGGGSHVEAG